MNRAFAIILIPALLVAIGYVVVFRSMGVSAEYWRLMLPAVALGGALLWLGRRAARKADAREVERRGDWRG
jgi:ABC-type glycerol-3-phosphate transport system permease component